MPMFCPNCGKAEQSPETYCRQCGEFLNDPSAKIQMSFGGSTPEEKINANLFLNLLSAIVSLILMIALYASFIGKRSEFPVVYFVAAFLGAMSVWQFSTFYVGLKLKRIFSRRKNAETKENEDFVAVNQFEQAKTGKILPEADFSDSISASVTENTTRNLNKISR